MISKRVYMESPTELNIFLTSSTFFLIRDACLMDSFSKGSKLFLSSKIAILPKQTFPPLSRSNIHYTFSHFRWCSKHLSFGIQGLTSVFFRRTAETVRRKRGKSVGSGWARQWLRILGRTTYQSKMYLSMPLIPLLMNEPWIFLNSNCISVELSQVLIEFPRFLIELQSNVNWVSAESKLKLNLFLIPC